MVHFKYIFIGNKTLCLLFCQTIDIFKEVKVQIATNYSNVNLLLLIKQI